VNTGLAVALFGLTSLALAMLLVPLLLRRHGAAGRDAYNLAVYRDQLTEVERDLARGALSAEQADAARAEIGRRILALRPEEAAAGAGGGPLVAAAVAVLALPVAAWVLYSQLGSPALPDQPFADRDGNAAPVAANGPHVDMAAAVAQLSDHLKQHPDDLTGWLLLARSELSLGHYADAAEAYRHAAELSGHRVEIVGDWGEAQVLAAGGTVTPAAQEAFEAGLKDPENAPRSRYYLALAQLQHGDAKGALKGWSELAAESPADAEWLPVVRQRIAQAAGVLGIDPATLKTAAGARPAAAASPPAAGGAPSGAAVAAAAKATADAPPEARQAMINGMVERLAARLEQQPDDVEGWARLGRSYMVLGEPGKARDAYARAVKLRPDDPALKDALAQATAAAGVPGPAAPK
jgi:cytochrome c-type biogenesis protein CcmH